jgi:hypothetical protein
MGGGLNVKNKNIEKSQHRKIRPPKVTCLWRLAFLT